jgi:hypothetical protein
MQNVMRECGDKREKMTSENHMSMIRKKKSLASSLKKSFGSAALPLTIRLEN